MKIIGVTAEFNPFHLGHEYFLKKIRELSGADYLICVMSGDFVQRGAPAIYDKYTRTLHALKGGADLVLELPVRYACGSAEIFARGAVNILSSLGCVDELWFGSEAGDINDIRSAAHILDNETPEFSALIQTNLSNGSSYSAARSKAAEKLYGTRFNDTISQPNNILGIEYCRALSYFSSRTVPKTISRKGGAYNDTDADPLYCSAAAVRKMILNGNMDALGHVPSYVYEDILNDKFIDSDHFSLLLRSKLLDMTTEEIITYRDINPDLANRIFRYKNDFTAISALTETVKSKNFTYSHISRALFSILLNLKNEPLYSDKTVRMLGHNGCAELFSKIKSTSKTDLVSKFCPEKDPCSEKDIYASDLYSTVKSYIYGLEFTKELSKKAPVICTDIQ